MADSPAPIPEFDGRTPVKLWRHHGIDCAIYMGAWAPCGYVRIPADSPLLLIAEAADVVYRVDDHDEWIKAWIDDQQPGAFGHQGLYELLEAPHGLTWGPTADGWVGFDTGHAFDHWDLDELSGYLPDGGRDREVFDYMREHGAHPSQILEMYELPSFDIRWTLDRLVAAVEHLADQVATAKAES